MKHTTQGRVRQRGVVLFVTLLFLIILTLIGITAARLQTAEERMAMNDDNHQLALQSGEATLRQAETLLGQGFYTPAQFSANSNGTYDLQTEVSSGSGSIIDTSNWAQQGIAYNGPTLGSVPTPPTPAKFVVESLPPVTRAGGAMCGSMYGGGSSACAIYRTTVIAEGGDATATAILQSYLQ